MKKILLILALLASMTGCVTNPVKEGAGSIAEKRFNFPDVGKKIHAVANGVILIKASYKSGYKYKLAAPLSLSLGFGAYSLQVGKDEELIPSILDGEELHCTANNSLRQLVGASSNRACFAISGTKATRLKYAPAAYWFTKDLDHPIEVSRREIAVNSSGVVTKSEVIYQGSSDGKIILVRNDFGEDLEVPSSSRPMLIEIQGGRIEVLGAKLKVENVNANSLTYSVESW